MKPHPDFRDRAPPEDAAFGRFRLERLTPAHVEEDFAIVTASASVLGGLFASDWPAGLTLEANLADLERHAREFEARYAFAWIIRDADGTYLGCTYLVPIPDTPGKGEVFTWIRDRADRLALLAEFNPAFRRWLTPHLPDGFVLTWASNDRPDGAG
ncbi:GNAT family N-acetyltransferase [Ovoidimarina sediminis]|uniref:GNAT family N-acetyltransferase n=1 Tax=Ovoidimarina sediminis TaxID=3079856 RepID=UPI00290BE4D3|nr:hypothetical protein [Rhodophyticola sp. MJ-SS7]MDU8942585.1 hypothetical protein [Rhodophyticola sp. MJ-SS7]